MLSKSFLVEDVLLLRSFHSIIRFGGFLILLSSNHHLFISRSCFLFLCGPINRSVVSSIQVLSSYQVLPLFSIGVLYVILLTPCAILSIVSEAVCCCFHQVSLHLLKLMLIPSIFRRSAVQILSFLFLGYTIAVSYSFRP